MHCKQLLKLVYLFVYGAGDGSQGLVHARQALYRSTTFPAFGLHCAARIVQLREIE
jgi:hypothetical protein